MMEGPNESRFIKERNSEVEIKASQKCLTTDKQPFRTNLCQTNTTAYR